MMPLAAFASEAPTAPVCTTDCVQVMSLADFLITVELPVMIVSSFLASLSTYILWGAYSAYKQFVGQFQKGPNAQSNPLASDRRFQEFFYKEYIGRTLRSGRMVLSVDEIAGLQSEKKPEEANFAFFTIFGEQSEWIKGNF